MRLFQSIESSRVCSSQRVYKSSKRETEFTKRSKRLMTIYLSDFLSMDLKRIRIAD